MPHSAEDERKDGRQLSRRDRVIGLALLLGIVALLVYLRTPEEPSPITERLLPPETPLDAAWLASLPVTEPWTEAARSYEDGRYAEAAAQFETLARQGGDDAAVAQLFLGSAYLLEGRAANAELALRLAARTRDVRVSDEARWRLAVSLLREDEMAAGRAELEALAREEGTHAAAARTLLSQLASRSALFP